MISINALLREELREEVVHLGEPAFRGDQIFEFLHKEKKTDWNEATTLPKVLRDTLKKRPLDTVQCVNRLDSQKDGTKKYLFQLKDGHYIETVYLANRGKRNTLCLSTQVGCRMGCVFCASTKQGFIRNLTAGEMVSQVYEVENDLGESIQNIVLMGIGEPLDNFQEVIRFLNIMHDEKGHFLSYRNITLSTCGIVDKIYRLADLDIPINLSISLHNGFQRKRQELMPIGRKNTIQELLKACSVYFDKTSRRVSFEYILIKGVNDSAEDVVQLTQLFHGKNVHINLIPLNEIEEYGHKKPEKEYIEKFKEALILNGINVTVRKEQGTDIQGACGQLRNVAEEGGSRI